MTEYFDISRKIIASVTSEGWKTIPHVCIVYEADVSLLMDVLQSCNRDRPSAGRISFNSVILRVLIEGIRACPKMNGHIKFNPWLVSGKVTTMEHIDISLPITYGDGKMATINLPQMENRSVREIQAMVADFRARIENTRMDRVLYRTGLEDTFSELRKGNAAKAVGRLLGAKLGPGRVRLGGRKSAGNEDCLKPENIKQGSITISNMGSLYKPWKGSCTILEIIPPQLCALAVGAVQKRAVADEEDRICVARIVPITIAFDHRALDTAELVPFMQTLDRLLQDREWLEREICNTIP